jgi:uncharacterized membrane protein
MVLDRFKEFREDVVWAGRVLRKARKHFRKVYLLTLMGTILSAVEHVVPNPFKTVFAAVSVACLGSSALVTWLILSD